ncbi:hypothetical protein NGRA_1582 [Nosema granulosis]|uniref:Uncharacterized protein n=1 Tax=Nosema granulosis TaxID=83296 RepID=A0A9P6GY73_9MICR|nr:hypothetical protein NGRA_1582 [Nosema granulosis]
MKSSNLVYSLLLSVICSVENQNESVFGTSEKAELIGLYDFNEFLQEKMVVPSIIKEHSKEQIIYILRSNNPGSPIIFSNIEYSNINYQIFKNFFQENKLVLISIDRVEKIAKVCEYNKNQFECKNQKFLEGEIVRFGKEKLDSIKIGLSEAQSFVYIACKSQEPFDFIKDSDNCPLEHFQSIFEVFNINLKICKLFSEIFTIEDIEKLTKCVDVISMEKKRELLDKIKRNEETKEDIELLKEYEIIFKKDAVKSEDAISDIIKNEDAIKSDIIKSEDAISDIIKSEDAIKSDIIKSEDATIGLNIEDYKIDKKKTDDFCQKQMNNYLSLRKNFKKKMYNSVLINPNTPYDFFPEEQDTSCYTKKFNKGLLTYLNSVPILRAYGQPGYLILDKQIGLKFKNDKLPVIDLSREYGLTCLTTKQIYCLNGENITIWEEKRCLYILYKDNVSEKHILRSKTDRCLSNVKVAVNFGLASRKYWYPSKDKQYYKTVNFKIKYSKVEKFSYCKGILSHVIEEFGRSEYCIKITVTTKRYLVNLSSLHSLRKTLPSDYQDIKQLEIVVLYIYLALFEINKVVKWSRFLKIKNCTKNINLYLLKPDLLKQTSEIEIFFSMLFSKTVLQRTLKENILLNMLKPLVFKKSFFRLLSSKIDRFKLFPPNFRNHFNSAFVKMIVN